MEMIPSRSSLRNLTRGRIENQRLDFQINRYSEVASDNNFNLEWLNSLD